MSLLRGMPYLPMHFSPLFSGMFSPVGFCQPSDHPDPVCRSSRGFPFFQQLQGVVLQDCLADVFFARSRSASSPPPVTVMSAALIIFPRHPLLYDRIPVRFFYANGAPPGPFPTHVDGGLELEAYFSLGSKFTFWRLSFLVPLG